MDDKKLLKMIETNDELKNISEKFNVTEKEVLKKIKSLCKKMAKNGLREHDIKKKLKFISTKRIIDIVSKENQNTTNTLLKSMNEKLNLLIKHYNISPGLTNTESVERAPNKDDELTSEISDSNDTEELLKMIDAKSKEKYEKIQKHKNSKKIK